METHRQGADGHRLFTAQFKQEQIARLAREELTLAELARELSVSYATRTSSYTSGVIL